MIGDRFGKLTIVSDTPVKIDDGEHKKLKLLCDCGKTHYATLYHLKSGDVSTCGNCTSHKDIKIGDIFGKLTVVGDREIVNKKAHYLTKCSCGNPEPKYVGAYYLASFDNIKNKGCGKCTEFDLVGKKFGELTVIKFIEKRGKKRYPYYLCSCSCGGENEVRRDCLLNGVSKNCGCAKAKAISNTNLDDLSGQVFRGIEVLKRSGTDKYGNALFECKCLSCYKTISISGNDLKHKKKCFCGCFNIGYTSQSHKTLMDNNDKKYVGKKIGMVTVIKRDKTESGKQGYLCRCDCGVEKTYNICWITKAFENGRNLNCGCGYRAEYLEKLKKEYVGKTFNRLTIKDIYMSQRKDGGSKAVAIADCSCQGENSLNREYRLSKLRTNHTKSCGCLFEEQVRENHPNWKPELTDEQRKENECRTGDPQYRKWRRAVLKRDKCCQVCGDKENSLHSHHIVPWSISEEKRFDVDNGITLCEECHVLFHSIYGQTENSPEDLEEFKRMY